MVGTNLRTEIKRLARIIALCLCDLSPRLDDHIQDVVAYRIALVQALLLSDTHLDSSTAVSPFDLLFCRNT